MSTFIEDYRRRVNSVDVSLRRMAHDLINDGYRVFASKDGLIRFIKIFKDNKHLTLGFTEVPYRWCISIDFIPSMDRGSGKVLKEFNYDDFPNKADIISNMKETPYANIEKHIKTLTI